jgi:hypothetical protein
MLADIALAVWNHPQGRAALISALASIPLYYNTPATRDLLERFAPTAIVVIALGLCSLPSGPIKAMQTKIGELEAEIVRLKRRRARR